MFVFVRLSRRDYCLNCFCTHDRRWFQIIPPLVTARVSQSKPSRRSRVVVDAFCNRTPATPALDNREMPAVKPAALARGQLTERFGDETPAVTMLTTTPNDALAHAEPVQTYEPPRAVPRDSARSTTIRVALAPDQMRDEVAFTRREKNVQNRVFNYERYTRHVQGPTPAAKQAAEKAATEQAKATQSTKGAYAGGMDQAGKCPAFPSPRKQENNGLSGEELCYTNVRGVEDLLHKVFARRANQSC